MPYPNIEKFIDMCVEYDPDYERAFPLETYESQLGYTKEAALEIAENFLANLNQEQKEVYIEDVELFVGGPNEEAAKVTNDIVDYVLGF